MSAVPAANCERSIFQIGERRNGTSAHRDDLCHPAEIGVAHGNRAAGVAAPLIRLQVSKVRIPCNIDTWNCVARLGEERHDLGLVALKENDLNGQMRFLVKVAAHSLPDRHHLRIVGNSSQPDCFAHRLSQFFCPPCQDIPWCGLDVLEERHSQQRLPDELAQNVARRRHDSARMRIAEQAFDVQMLGERRTTANAHRC